MFDVYLCVRTYTCMYVCRYQCLFKGTDIGRGQANRLNILGKNLRIFWGPLTTLK